MFMCFIGPLRHLSSGELHCAKLHAKLQYERAHTLTRTGQPAETTHAEREKPLNVLSRKIHEELMGLGQETETNTTSALWLYYYYNTDFHFFRSTRYS